MTTGRINQVARKVSTPPPQAMAHKPSDKPSAAHAAESTRTRHAKHTTKATQRPTDSAIQREPSKARANNNCRHRPNEFGSDLRRDDQNTKGAPIRTRLCETSCNTNQTKDHSKAQSARAAQQASTRKSQCSVHKPHSINHTRKHKQSTRRRKSKPSSAGRANEQRAGPLTPAVQPPDTAQHKQSSSATATQTHCKRAHANAAHRETVQSFRDANERDARPP